MKNFSIWGFSDSKLCKICQHDTDTIKHAFLDCHPISKLWLQVQNWAKSQISTSIKLSDIDKLFGYQCNNRIINKTILNTILVIYNNRKSERKCHIKMVKRLLYNELCTEEYEAKINQNEQEFWVTWGEIYDDLTEIFSS